jgi:hypothetical protein
MVKNVLKMRTLLFRSSMLSLIFIICITLGIPYLFKSETEHTGYWVWRQSDLAQLQNANEIIIYQGEFYNTNGKFEFKKKGINIQDLKNRNVTLLLRAYQLPSVHFFTNQVDYLINEWQQKGVPIKGIQIDYDSPSSKLHEYGDFLKNLNQTYEPSFVSITGLSSWMADNIKGLNDLAPYVDYVAIQFYQNFHPVYNAGQYIKHLKTLTLNYKVGVTPSAKFERFTFEETPYYVGKLIFLNGKKIGTNQLEVNR